MKAVILAGGLGTRLSEETHLKPKPMVEIGGLPILWHILKIYSYYGINDFIICCGYKGYYIKEYFFNYYNHNSDIEIDLNDNSIEVLNKKSEKWKIKLIDTGLNTMTGGRIKRIYDYVKNDDCFCLTYGDGVANINITELIKFHKEHKRLATMTVAYSPARFGSTIIKDKLVEEFKEKPFGEGGMINAGFFVLSPKVIEHVEDDTTVWEQYPLKNLAKLKELMAFKHTGFWRPMDTLRDKTNLNKMWEEGDAEWKVW